MHETPQDEFSFKGVAPDDRSGQPTPDPAPLPVDGLDGVYAARSGKLSCTALRLRDGGLCLYSPVAGLERTLLAQAGELGPVSALLAPNHYHNKGLAAHLEAFPNAALHCSSAAAPRLKKITGLSFGPLETLRPLLVNGHVLHEAVGLKTGEVWVLIPSPAGCALVVTDAFSSATQPPGEICERVTMLGTFPRYGVDDAGAVDGKRQGALGKRREEGDDLPPAAA